jgi:glycosyltransferase involved in cell wall biosynthesis
MNVKHICFLSAMHPSHDKRVFDKEAVYLAAAGFDVTHICPGDKEQTIVEKGVRSKVYPKPSGIRGRLLQLVRLYRMAKEADADVYHCNEVDSWFVGVVLRIFRGKRCIFDVHEHYPSTFAESRFPKVLQPAVAFCVRLVFLMLSPFTDFFVLAKKSVSSDFRVAKRKKVLVRNFTPLAALRMSEESSPRKATQEPECVRIVHLGFIGRARGWPQILDAMAEIQQLNVQLEIIGEFNDNSEGEFKQRLIDLELSDCVTLLDWMPFDQAFEHMRSAQIGLIVFQPGIRNHVFAMPHKMFDYMAAGMAVILPDFAVEVAPIVLETGCGVVVNPADSGDLAAKLSALIGDPGAMHEMGLRGQRAVKEKYNWDAEFSRLLEMYSAMQLRRPRAK